LILSRFSITLMIIDIINDAIDIVNSFVDEMIDNYKKNLK